MPAGAEVDFADEEAALAAQDAGLELEGETAEEAAADQLAEGGPSAEDKFAGKGKEELVALFTRMLEEQPVQSIRRDVEALKIAFYRIRRADGKLSLFYGNYPVYTIEESKHGKTDRISLYIGTEKPDGAGLLEDLHGACELRGIIGA